MSYTNSGFDKRVRNLLMALESIAPPPPPPPAPPTGMLQWLNNDSLSALSNNDPVSTWPDSSGNGLDCTQTGAARPIYRTSGFPLGNACVDFADDSSQYMNMPVGFSDFTAGLTLVQVVHSSATGAVVPQANYGISDNAVTSAFSFVTDLAADSYGILALDPGLVFFGSAAGIDFSPALLVFEIDAAGNGRVELNHVDIASGAIGVPTVTARNLNFLGNDAIAGIFAWCGRMAESILYDRVLSASDRAELDAYIADKYGL